MFYNPLTLAASSISYRNWTTAPLVLEFLENNELQALPLVLQFAVVQQLSFATSRIHQECIIHAIRHAYWCSGLLELEKDPYSNLVKERGVNSSVSESSHVSSPREPGKLSTCASSNSGCSLSPPPQFDDVFGESSLLSLLGDDGGDFLGNEGSMEGLAAQVSSKECLLSELEQQRLSALTFECFLMVKTRFQELRALSRSPLRVSIASN